MEVVLRSGHFFAHRGPGGKVVSTAAIFPYSTLASLGVVMVDPDYRRRGLATRLVDACISAVPDRPILLVATEEGKPLYEKLGFKTVGTLDKLVAKRYTGGLQRMTHQQTVASRLGKGHRRDHRPGRKGFRRPAGAPPEAAHQAGRLRGRAPKPDGQSRRICLGRARSGTYGHRPRGRAGRRGGRAPDRPDRRMGSGTDAHRHSLPTPAPGGLPDPMRL